MTEHTTRTIDGVGVINEITDGKLTIEDSSREATLHVKKAHRTLPLSDGEPHLNLYVNSDDGSTEVTLDGKQLDALVDAVYKIQEEYRNESRQN